MVPLHIFHNGYGGYSVDEGTPEPEDDPRLAVAIGLPLQGRKERVNLYRWMALEEEYVADKFDDQRDGHDESMQDLDLENFWFRQISQYWDRAMAFLIEAKMCREREDKDGERDMTVRAQQALAKGLMTHKGMVESSIRCFGNLPKPGLSSGYIEPWEG